MAIDLDKQANLSELFNIDDDNENKIKNLFLEKDINLNDLIIKTTNTNINVIPNNLGSFDLESILNSKPVRERILEKIFYKNSLFLNQYDYIIIDTAPDFNTINTNACVSANSIVLISDRSKASFNSLIKFYDTWKNTAKDLQIKNKINGVILNKFNNFKQSEYFLQQINNSILKNLICLPCIMQKSVFEKSETYKKNIDKLLPKKENVYFELTKNLIKKGVL